MQTTTASLVLLLATGALAISLEIAPPRDMGPNRLRVAGAVTEAVHVRGVQARAAAIKMTRASVLRPVQGSGGRPVTPVAALDL